MESIIMAEFPVESEAYQAFSELKRDMDATRYLVLQAVLVKKQGDSLITCDEFDTGIETGDDTLSGGLIGSLVGILGGPLGVLLGASVGGLIGAAVDAGDIAHNGSVIEKTANALTDGTVAILAFAQENGNTEIDSKFMKYDASITRYDAAEVAEEIEAAHKAQEEMERQARAELRRQKNDTRKAKLDEKRARIAAGFDALKIRLQNKS